MDRKQKPAVAAAKPKSLGRSKTTVRRLERRPSIIIEKKARVGEEQVTATPRGSHLTLLRLSLLVT